MLIAGADPGFCNRGGGARCMLENWKGKGDCIDSKPVTTLESAGGGGVSPQSAPTGSATE